MSRPSFSRIYVDTNILLGTGWPRLSAGLEDLLSLADFLNIPVCLPEPVEIELEAQWREGIGKHLAAVDRGRRSLREILKKVSGTLPKFPLIDGDDAADKYRSMVGSVKSTHSIQVCPLAAPELGVIFRLAASHHPPFQDQDRGFRDAVIYFSIIADLRENAATTGAFLTTDRIVLEPEVSELSSNDGIDIVVFAALADLSKELRTHIADTMKAAWDVDRKRAAHGLQEMLPAIETYLKENVEVQGGGFFPKLRSVTGIVVNRLLKNSLSRRFVQ